MKTICVQDFQQTTTPKTSPHSVVKRKIVQRDKIKQLSGRERYRPTALRFYKTAAPVWTHPPVCVPNTRKPDIARPHPIRHPLKKQPQPKLTATVRTHRKGIRPPPHSIYPQLGDNTAGARRQPQVRIRASRSWGRPVSVQNAPVQFQQLHLPG